MLLLFPQTLIILPVLLLSYLNEYSIKSYKRNWFVTLLKMKINKQVAFASFHKAFIKIVRSKVRVSAWILEISEYELAALFYHYYISINSLSDGTNAIDILLFVK